MRKLVCLGDSNTYGQHLPPKRKWPTVVADTLNDWEVVNAGVCGEQTRMALERFPKAVQEVRPDALTIQYGTNDANRWKTDCGVFRVSAEAFQANLVEMVTRSRVFGIRHVAFIELAPCTRDSVQPQWWRYRGCIRSAAERTGVTLLNPRLTEAHLQEDGVHLTAEGAQQTAECVAEWLVSVSAPAEAVAA